MDQLHGPIQSLKHLLIRNHHLLSSTLGTWDKKARTFKDVQGGDSIIKASGAVGMCLLGKHTSPGGYDAKTGGKASEKATLGLSLEG